MAKYRLYCLRLMVLAGSAEIEAESDAEAVRAARQWAKPGHAVEIWLGDRRVRKIRARKLAAGPAA